MAGEVKQESNDSLFLAMSDAILAMASERKLERVLKKLVESAQKLAHAKYAALGIPDEEGEAFSQFIYTGMSDELVAHRTPAPQAWTSRRHAQ